MKLGRRWRQIGVDWGKPPTRRARVAVALCTPAYAAIGVAAVFSAEGPRSTARVTIAAAVCLSTLPAAALMARWAPGPAWWRRSAHAWQSSAFFVVYCDLGIAAVLMTFVDLEASMYGTALFAVTSIYAGQFVNRRVVIGHVIFTSGVIIAFGYATWTQGHHDAAGVFARCLVSLFAANVSALVYHESTENVQRTLQTHLDEATQDSLTGLCNRRGFTTQVTRLLAGGARIGFIVIDVDRFKLVNDTHGHTAGDEVLSRLGARLHALVGTSVIAARTGGEEFALAASMESINLTQLAEQVRAAVHDPADEIPVTVSVGVATWSDSSDQVPDAEPAERITRGMISADIAMYAAKSCGGNCVITREITVGTPADRRIKLTLPGRTV